MKGKERERERVDVSHCVCPYRERKITTTRKKFLGA